MQHLRKLAGLVLLTVVTFTGVAVAKDLHVFIVTHGQASDPFWAIVKKGADDAAHDTGVILSYRAPDTFDMVAMAQLITASANQRPDGLIVSIPDADALGDAIKSAVAQGIPVISINSGAQVSKELGTRLHVGQDEYSAGVAAGEKLAQLGGHHGICVNHEVGNAGLDQRCKGFAKGFSGKTSVLPTTEDPADTVAKVRAALQADPSIDTILTLSASLTGEATMDALRQSGQMGKVKVASFDLATPFLGSVADGSAAFALDQQPYLQGYLPVAILALNAKYGLMPSSNIQSGPNLVTRDAAAQVTKLASEGIR
jgi:simple sugar transport system substrate-binding protein